MRNDARGASGGGGSSDAIVGLPTSSRASLARAKLLKAPATLFRLTWAANAHTSCGFLLAAPARRAAGRSALEFSFTSTLLLDVISHCSHVLSALEDGCGRYIFSASALKPSIAWPCPSAAAAGPRSISASISSCSQCQQEASWHEGVGCSQFQQEGGEARQMPVPRSQVSSSTVSRAWSAWHMCHSLLSASSSTFLAGVCVCDTQPLPLLRPAAARSIQQRCTLSQRHYTSVERHTAATYLVLLCHAGIVLQRLRRPALVAARLSSSPKASMRRASVPGSGDQPAQLLRQHQKTASYLCHVYCCYQDNEAGQGKARKAGSHAHHTQQATA